MMVEQTEIVGYIKEWIADGEPRVRLDHNDKIPAWMVRYAPTVTPLVRQDLSALPAIRGAVDMRKAVAQAIFDPGATEGYKGDRSLTEWQTDAVMRALAAIRSTQPE